jgi:hypothetical protein
MLATNDLDWMALICGWGPLAVLALILAIRGGIKVLLAFLDWIEP